MTLPDRLLSGWSGVPATPGRFIEPPDAETLCQAVGLGESYIARGAGRSYGDAAHGDSLTVSTRRLTRLLTFDRETGIVACESGMLLATLIRLTAPRGWVPHAIPGTSAVTVGGMIAADVHGKDQRLNGTFGSHLISLTLLLGDGSVAQCSPIERAELFEATVGGMGLTGLILTAKFKLQHAPSTRVVSNHWCTGDLEETVEALDSASSAGAAVAWIDAMALGSRRGRGIVHRGRFHDGSDHRATGGTPERVSPVEGFFPRSRLPLFTSAGLVKVLNRLHWSSSRLTRRKRVQSMAHFFFPLDRARWLFAMYGANGFVQFHCVIPRTLATETVGALLECISESGVPCPLAALKSMGDRSGGILSFPMDGLSLAADLAMNRRRTPALYRDLEAILLGAGGRIYMAKDALMSPESLNSGYPEIHRFRNVIESLPGANRLRSRLSVRLGIQAE